MKFHDLLALAAFSLPSLVGAQSLPVNRETVWFKPSLTADSAPFCADVLREVQDTFFSARERSDYASLTAIQRSPESTSPHDEIVGTGFDQQWQLTRPNGERVFAKLVRFPGCGGACETERVRISDKLIEKDEAFYDETLPGTPRAARWNIHEGPDGEFYAMGVVDEAHLSVYRLAGPSSVDLACEVELKPDKLFDYQDPAIRQASQSLEELTRAFGSVSRGGGSCGTLRPHERGYERLDRALQEALYRPWIASDPDVATEAVFSRLRRFERAPASLDQHLENWALGGIGEYRAWQRYLVQLEQTVAAVSELYRQKYSWSDMQARERAGQAVRRALERAFAFPSEQNLRAADAPLRRAILERQPLSVIKQQQLRERAEEADRLDEHENILNVAIEYPEALQYLLSEGSDPNVANAFGKTPLMYAAQYNQLESVRILLAAGADPNAETYIPEDNCYYTLDTTSMTALHYAARYADASLIRLLVAEGAATFTEASNNFEMARRTPLDWLNIYTHTESSERNPHIDATEVPALTKLLTVPDYPERRRTSMQLTTRAQAEYARGEYKSAYRHLKAALTSQPDNEKALSDLPLMAEKLGKLDEAIPAARRAIDMASSAPMEAAAWFNLGLLCTGRNVFTEEHCDPDWIQPFIHAWKLEPSAARASKLTSIFHPGAGECTSAGNRHQLILSTPSGPAASQVQRIYVLHQVVDPMDMELGQLRLVDMVTLGEVAITTLEGPRGSSLQQINGHPCRVPTN